MGGGGYSSDLAVRGSKPIVAYPRIVQRRPGLQAHRGVVQRRPGLQAHRGALQRRHTRQQSYNLALSRVGIVRWHRLSARCMATSCIRSSSTCGGFSIQMILRSQICPIFENLTTISKVQDRFSTSWDSELLFRLQPYTIMVTLPSI
jgi:hypothetical protein